MEKLFKDSVCRICKTLSPCLDLPCKHYTCKKCYTDYYRPRLAVLYRLICQNVEHYNGKSTCLSCTFNCDASQLSVDPNVLIELYGDIGDQDSRSYATFFKLFLAGIPSFFLFCAHCNELHVDTKFIEICPMIRERYVPDLNQRTRKLLEDYKNPIHNFEFVDIGDRSNALEENQTEHLIMLDNNKQPKPVGNMVNRFFKLNRNNAQSCLFFALASIQAVDQNDCIVNIQPGSKPLIKAIYSITNTNDARLGTKSIIDNIMKNSNLNFRYEFVRNSGQKLMNDKLVNETGINVLLLVGQNRDIIYEKQGNYLKVYKLSRKYLNLNVEFTVGKAVVVDGDDEEFIIIEQFDMVSFSQIYRVTGV